MKSSAEFWDKQYPEGPGFEELSRVKPSRAILRFLKYLHSIPLQGTLLETGCGMELNIN